MNQGTFYHGTSKNALCRMNDKRTVIPVYTLANISLGGCYLTRDRSIAEVAARNAALVHNSFPTVIIVDPIFELLPDEDWVVPLIERPLDEDFDFKAEAYKDHRLQSFVDDLMTEYLGNGHSISDEYARRYQQLNALHQITYQDSLRYTENVRQKQILTVEQIIKQLPLST